MNDRSMLAYLAIPLLLVTANWVAPGYAPSQAANAANGGSAPASGLERDQAGSLAGGKDAPQRVRPLKTACEVLTDFLGVREVPAVPVKPSSVSISVKDSKDQTSSLTISASNGEDRSFCDAKAASAADVDFAFVFVPDPTQSSVALETDRAFDAVRLAMTKRGYIPYKANVLPWKTLKGQEKEGPKKDPTAEATALALPGVWLFRGKENEKEHLKLLFLIGDSPTVGISKVQFHNAFDQYRSLSASNKLEIVGPIYSGSVNSLGHALQSLCGPGKSCPRWIVNATSGTAEVKGLETVLRELASGVAEVHLSQLAKQDSMKSLCNLLNPADKTAILSEADTIFGQTVKEQCDGAEVFRYSRDLANLRAAYEADSDLMARIFPKSVRPDQLALRFGFNREPSDSIPVYAPENLAVSQQITLRHLAKYLQRRNFVNLIVVASDTLDTVFLSRFFQDENPNLRIAAFDSDALLDREAGAVSLRGVITISLQPTGSVTGEQVELPSGLALGIYRACLQGLFSEADPRNLVVSVVGYDGEWPLKALSPDGTKVAELQPRRSFRFFHWQRPVIAFTLCLAWLCLFPLIAHFGPGASLRGVMQLVAPFCRPAAFFPDPVFVPKPVTVGGSGGTGTQMALENTATVSDETRRAEGYRLRWVQVCILTGACTLAVLIGLAVAAMTLPAKSFEYPALVARYFYFGNGVSPILPLAALLLALHACAWSRVRSCYLSAYTYRPTPASLPFEGEAAEGGRAAGREIQLLLSNVRQSAERFIDRWLLLLAVAGSITAMAYDIVVHDVEIELGSRWTTRIWTILFTAVPILVANAASRFWFLWIRLQRLLRRLEFHPLRLGCTTLPDRISWTTIWSFGGMRPTMASLQMSSDYLSAIDEANHNQENLAARRRIDQFMESVHNGSFRVDPDALMHLQAIQEEQDKITDDYIQDLCTNGFWSSHRIEGWHPDEPAGASKPGNESAMSFRITREEGGSRSIESRRDLAESLQKKLNKLKCEFIALQYAAFIRYAFMQLRNLLGFLVTASSLLFIAINVYPFQPIGTLTNFATFLFIGCALVAVTAFYQMDRDHLLSRLSNTKAGKLDAGFGWRLVQFGALPTVTFLATHFPPIGQALVKFAQIIPGLSKL